MKIIITFLLLVLLILQSSGCKSGTVAPKTPPPKWITFTKSTTAGILSDNIYTIYITGTGQVWFGSDNGAFYLQGGAWSYPPPDSFNYLTGPNRIVERKVTAISEGKYGSLWFGLKFAGTFPGIRRLNPADFPIRWQSYSVGNNFITGISTDELKSNEIWVTTTDGFFRYAFSTGDDITKGVWDQPYTNLPDTKVNCLTINQKNGWRYFGTDNGLTYYNSNTDSWNNIALPPEYNSNIISIAVQYTSNTIWLGKRMGVSRYTLGTNDEHHYLSTDTSSTHGKLPDGSIFAVMTDFFSTTRWFGTGSGLVQMKDQEWKLFTKENTSELPSNMIQALYYDYIKKNLWIGTNQGIAVYNENGVQL
jgi:ligand-binding sensor domain-containing protein